MRWACLGAILGMLCGCAVQPIGPVGAEQAARAAKANTDIAAYHLQRGDYAEALEKVERALEQSPDLTAAHVIAAELNARIDRPEIASRHYQRALQLEPDNGAALNNYAAFLCRDSQIERALDLWTLAASNRLYEGRAMALSNAGRCLANAGHWAAARSYWQRALDARPDYPPAIDGLAEAARELKQSGAATQAFSRYTEALGESRSQLADRVDRDEY